MSFFHILFNCIYISWQRHGRRKRGYAGDLTPPTIYVGDIDMYIPPGKT